MNKTDLWSSTPLDRAIINRRDTAQLHLHPEYEYDAFYCSTDLSSSLTVPQLWDPPPPRFSSALRLLKQTLKFNWHKFVMLINQSLKADLKEILRGFKGTGITHERSLPLCLSNSRLPRESNPSLRPMPLPRPPRAPLPPPRPRNGRSPTDLTKEAILQSKEHILVRLYTSLD